MLTSLKPCYYLGLDIGGTHIDAAIANESGYVLGRGKSLGGNVHNYDLEIVLERMLEALSLAEDQVKQKKHPHQLAYETCCIGVAGLDTDKDFAKVENFFLEHKLLQKFKAKRILLCNDGLIGLKSGTESNYGVCLVAGTGSNCYGLAMNGLTAKAGNWGYLLGDQASGFHLGQIVLQEVMKEHDGRKPESLLTKKVLATLKLKSIGDLVNFVYQKRVPVAEIASLSQLGSDPDIAKLPIIVSHIDQAAQSLIDAYDAVYHKLQFSSQDNLPIVLIGGLFKLEDLFTATVIAGIKIRTPKATIIRPKRPPVEGAVHLAMMGNYVQTLPDTVLCIQA